MSEHRLNAIPVSISPLGESDMDEVMTLEQTIFKNQWPASAFLNEIKQNRMAHYFGARLDRALIGYAGFWLVLEEAHITTVAVHPNYRQRKIGEQLLLHLLTMAVVKGCRWATLEVRESNEAAQQLYKKFGFIISGIRKDYYPEYNENAVVMWSGNLRGENFKKMLAMLRKEMGERLRASV